MEAKEKILGILKKEKNTFSSSRIAGIVGIDYNYAVKLLEELLNEGKIEKMEMDKFTFWKLKGAKNEKI
jgi:predicted transcriptional regulator